MSNVTLKSVASKAGLSCNYRMPFTSALGADHFYSAYREVLTYVENNQPLAEVYFCYSDLMALGMFRAFVKKGIRVPEDVSIVTTDNSILAKTNSVPLTSLAYPSEAIARLAIESVLEGEQIQITLIAPAVWRGSTR